uniref:Zinc finger and BTB domain containing 25 n=1 Tax=Electrophorus electricus TaxID=8005 RepID=A0A4W4FM63_ELEEL
MDVASHSLFLLKQLNVQREFGFLCDCTVAIGNVYFKAHRAVLAAFSNYFKMIFIHQSRLRKMACAVCNQRFSQKSQLQEHMFAHAPVLMSSVFVYIELWFVNITELD